MLVALIVAGPVHRSVKSSEPTYAKTLKNGIVKDIGTGSRLRLSVHAVEVDATACADIFAAASQSDICGNDIA